MAHLLTKFSYSEMGLSDLSCYDAVDKPSIIPTAKLNLPLPNSVENDITEPDTFQTSSETTSQVLQELDDLMGF